MAEPRGTLTPEQVAQLLEAVRPNRVRQNRGKDHMEGYDIRAHLNRIFGFGHWDLDGPSAELLFEEQLSVGEKDNGWPNMRWEVGYVQMVILTVYDPNGLLVGRYRGEAVGKAENQPSRGDAHDGAMKEAETQALKRAAINLGDQFGLGLYNKNSRNRDGSYKAVVKRTLVGMPEAKAAGPSVDHDAPDVAPEEGESPEDVLSVSDGSATSTLQSDGGIRTEPAHPTDARRAAAAGSGPMASTLRGIIDQADREDTPRREAIKAMARESAAPERVTAAHVDTLRGERDKLSSAGRAAIGQWALAEGINAQDKSLHLLDVPTWNRVMAAVKRQLANEGNRDGAHRPPPPSQREPKDEERLRFLADAIGRVEILGEGYQEELVKEINNAFGDGETALNFADAVHSIPRAWDEWLRTVVEAFEEDAGRPFEEPEPPAPPVDEEPDPEF